MSFQALTMPAGVQFENLSGQPEDHRELSGFDKGLLDDNRGTVPEPVSETGTV